jgi:hypothetical protein
MAFSRSGSASSPLLPVTVTLYPSFHRMQSYGIDGAGSVSIAKHDVGTRFEFAFYQRDNGRAETAPPEFRADLIKANVVHGVLGADYTLPTSILGTILYGNLQYVFYREVGLDQAPAGGTVIRGLPVVIPWDSDGVLYLEDRIGSKFKLTANVIGSFAYGDGLVSPGANYALTDNLKATCWMDFFVGSTGGFFGQFHDNRRVNLTLSYVF